MIFGTNALVVKPAISLSPMLVVSVLNAYGYQDLKDNKLSEMQTMALKDSMFSFLYIIPVLLGCLQFVIWMFYSLRHTHKSPICQ